VHVIDVEATMNMSEGSDSMPSHCESAGDSARGAGRSAAHLRGRAGKMLVPLLGVVAALALGVAAVGIVLQTQEREKRLAKEQELALVLAERQDLKEQLTKATQAKGQLEEELGRVRSDLTASQDKLAQATKAQEELSKSLDERQEALTKLTKDVTTLRSERDDASTKLQDLSSEREALQRRLTDLEQAKGELEAKVMELSEQPTVELDRITVAGAHPPAGGSAGTVQPVSAAIARPSSASDGQVVVINREYDFIVLNMGKNPRLSVGPGFRVRDSQVLGKVKVEKVYDELSAAALLPGSQKENIREGDVVRAL
jgi:predicted RNase H-like nuclease (RuvC/YqgF family)